MKKIIFTVICCFVGLCPFGSRIKRWYQKRNWPKPFLPSDEVEFRKACQGVCGNEVLSSPLQDEQNAWYIQKPLIWAHAAGARQILFANTKEAIDDSIGLGFKVIEVDVSITSDGIPVLSHGFRPNNERQFWGVPSYKKFMRTRVCGKYTPVSVQNLVDWYANYDGYFSIDQTLTSLRPRFDLINYMRSLPKSFLGKVIFQAYYLDELKELKEKNPFAAVHYCLYPIPDVKRIPDLISVLKSANVHSVSFGDQKITDNIRRIVQLFNEANIYVSVARVDTLEKYLAWRAVGVKCINSNYLTPADIQNL